MSYGRKSIEGWGWKITFEHVLTGNSVSFQSFITEYTDSFTPSWKEETIYGRMDPLVTYTGTRRSVNFSWDVVSDTLAEAQANLGKFEKLARMLYPTYSDTPGPAGTTGEKAKPRTSMTMTGAPLVRVKFVNLIQNANGGTGSTMGLLGAIKDSVQFKPKMESGFVTNQQGVAIPKIYSSNCSLTVLHEHELGWSSENKSWLGASAFPYGIPAADKKSPERKKASAGQTDQNAPMSVVAGQSSDFQTGEQLQSIEKSKEDKVLMSVE